MKIGIIPFPTVLKGILITFLAIILVYINWQIFDFLNKLGWQSSAMKIAFVFAFWSIVFWSLYFGLWIEVLGHNQKGDLGEQ